MRSIIYIISPYSGDEERNVEFARAACRRAIQKGTTPFAPHLLYPQMLDNSVPEERVLGREMGMQMIKYCNAAWLCGDRISEGMARELEKAWELGIPLVGLSEQEIMENAMEEPENREDLTLC